MIARLALIATLLFATPAAASPPGRWESQPPAPAPRQEAAFAELGGKLYLAGGFEYGGVDSLRHEVFDVATKQWSVAPPLPEPAHHLAGAAAGGKLYYLGGLQTLQFLVTGRVWEYDPATGGWAARASMPAGRARGAGAVAVYDGKLVYAGGLRGGSAAVADVDVYDPATDTWRALPDMPTARDHLGLAIVGHVAYAVGGRQGAFGTEIAATEALDLRTRRWRTALARIPTPRAGFAAGVVGGELVTVGGESPAGVHDQSEAYDPDSDRWRELAPSPLPRHGIQGVAHGGGLWVAGGGTDLLVAATASLDVLFPGPRPVATGAPTPAAPAPPAAAAPSKPLRLRPGKARRGARRVVVRVSGKAASVILQDRRGRVLARSRPATGRVVLRLRRRLTRGRYSLTARAADGATVSAALRVR